jgi:polyhydroxyalkanoate synthesis regulator phasin
MEKLFQKALLAGLGLLDLTKEKAEKIVEELVKKGEVAKEKQPDFAKRVLERTKKGRSEIEKIVENATTKVIKKLDIAAKSDIERLIKKMGDLEKRIKK